MTPTRKVWTLASVTALFGAVACGSFGTGSSDDPPRGLAEDAGSEAASGDGPVVPSTDAAPSAPPCLDSTDRSISPDHCGVCDHSCLGGGCEGGKCQPVTIAKIGAPGYVRHFGEYLFLVSDSAVMRVSKRTAQPVVAISGPVNLRTGIAVDERNVFAAGTDGLRMYPHETGAEVLISALPTTEVAVDGANVFTCLLADKTPLLKFARSPSVGVQVVKDTKNCESIAPDKASVVFGGDALHRASATATMQKVDDVKVFAIDARRVALDDKWIYSIANKDDAVSRTSRDGKASDAIAKGAIKVDQGDIAVDATDVYWTSGTAGGSVYRAPKGGGDVETIAANAGVPKGITVDDVAVYWTEYETGLIRKRAK